LSQFKACNQKSHSKNWLLSPQNIGLRLSLDETAFSNGDLYTIITNKDAKGMKSAIIAMIKGTKAEVVIEILHKIPLKYRKKVKEVTLDMAGNMGLIVRKSFPEAALVIDSFHVQKLALDALQEIRIKHRWQAIVA
jgi:transposase